VAITRSADKETTLRAKSSSSLTWWAVGIRVSMKLISSSTPGEERYTPLRSFGPPNAFAVSGPSLESERCTEFPRERNITSQTCRKFFFSRLTPKFSSTKSAGDAYILQAFHRQRHALWNLHSHLSSLSYLFRYRSLLAKPLWVAYFAVDR